MVKVVNGNRSIVKLFAIFVVTSLETSCSNVVFIGLPNFALVLPKAIILHLKIARCS